MKKIIITILIVIVFLVLGATAYVGYRLTEKDLFGWRMNFSLNKVETDDYHSFGPTVAFKYPKIFEIDTDPEKRYGSEYVVGIKLKTEERTGCDIRRSGPQLDFSQSTEVLTEEIVKPIREKATDFKLLSSEKTKISGQDAIRISFSFLDPIGARIRLDEIFTKGKDGTKYMIICGVGEYQFDFFEKDFRVFYDSISFDGQLTKQKTWMEEFRGLVTGH